MKIIDLLNKIANGEKVPKKIAIQNEVLIYNEGEILNLQDYYYKSDDEDATWEIWAYDLNYEVEILGNEDEDKKIPEKLKILRGVEYGEEILPNDKMVTNKINEIIDYLKSKRE